MEHVDALRDPDPGLTAEWCESLAELISSRGAPFAAHVLAAVSKAADSVGVSASHRWPVNDIPFAKQGMYPGDERLEAEIEAAVRWNAMAIVQRANTVSPGLGGHLSTFAASATMQEVLRNHFWRGPDHRLGQDRVFFQGHASPGVYARAFLEGRLDEGLLDRFRREVPSPGLSSYPHPRLRPGFWEQPTVSMGLGPLTAIHAAAMDRYLFDRGLVEHVPRTFCFVGDGECDEPETLGALAVASRLGLSNLVFVVVCNLQRLDGPVRGGSSVIAELAGIFSGASWRVIRAVWGSSWDGMFDHPSAHLLAHRLGRVHDGDLQRWTACDDGALIRAELTDGDVVLESMFDRVSDGQLVSMVRDRAGHDRCKMFAAFSAAVEPDVLSRPTVVLALCEKGYGLPQVASRNAAHQVKGLSASQLSQMAARLGVSDRVTSEQCEAGMPPYVRLSSAAAVYLSDRVAAQGGSLPARRVVPVALPKVADVNVFAGFDAGSATEVSTTVAHTRLLRDLMRDSGVGPHVVPVVADEGRTFGFEPLYAEFGVWAPGKRGYTSVDAHLPLAYQERSDGRFVQVGISESNGLAALSALGVSGFRGVPTVPVFEFYSMFGFQRVADLIWAAMDAQASGILVGATAGRTTLHGEGLQHADGHSQAWAQAVPGLWAYDPSFAFETAVIYRFLLERMPQGLPTLAYLTLYNENYRQPARPLGVSDADVVSGCYEFARSGLPDSGGRRVKVVFSGPSWRAAVAASELLAEHGVVADLVACPSVKAVAEDARRVVRSRRAGVDVGLCRWERVVGECPVVFVSEYVAQTASSLSSVSSGGLVCVGTDGFGRSSERGELREFFEVSAAHVALAGLYASGAAPLELAACAAAWGVDVSSPPPWER